MAALAWVIPMMIGVCLIVVDKAFTGSMPPWPQTLDQAGLFNRYFPATLIWAPLWGFPAVVVGLFPLRQILIVKGWFGWASALAAGALAGIAVPVVFGPSYWLIGPLYGAGFLWIQQAIFKARYPATFGG